MYGDGVNRQMLGPLRGLGTDDEQTAGMTGTSWFWLGAIALVGVAVLVAEKKLKTA